jgi:hypothetical protein
MFKKLMTGTVNDNHFIDIVVSKLKEQIVLQPQKKKFIESIIFIFQFYQKNAGLTPEEKETEEGKKKVRLFEKFITENAVKKVFTKVKKAQDKNKNPIAALIRMPTNLKDLRMDYPMPKQETELSPEDIVKELRETNRMSATLSEVEANKEKHIAKLEEELLEHFKKRAPKIFKNVKTLSIIRNKNQLPLRALNSNEIYLYFKMPKGIHLEIDNKVIPEKELQDSFIDLALHQNEIGTKGFHIEIQVVIDGKPRDIQIDWRDMKEDDVYANGDYVRLIRAFYFSIANLQQKDNKVINPGAQ